jgi:hypothetical protein
MSSVIFLLSAAMQMFSFHHTWHVNCMHSVQVKLYLAWWQSYLNDAFHCAQLSDHDRHLLIGSVVLTQLWLHQAVAVFGYWWKWFKTYSVWISGYGESENLAINISLYLQWKCKNFSTDLKCLWVCNHAIKILIMINFIMCCGQNLFWRLLSSGLLCHVVW